MSDSQEQSLDENAVFLPVDESSPEFLHCEREREAVERLLSAGPEAFYSSIGTECSGCFLSSEEVSQITSWAQNYDFNHLQQENAVESSTDVEDFSSTYFPCHSDMPTPNLELGWPEKNNWVPQGSVTVHTSPPAEGQPPVREFLWINTSFYESIQENFTLNRLRHPNMRVRLLGGTSFCSRTGRMVFGEMKNKFLLVDLETVIHGSYSLTWTDAHLHRQLITVLSGPVVDAFDREFRILFAASLPVPNTWRVTGTNAHVNHQLKDFPPLRFQKQVSLEPDIFSPPSPPADFLMDWEAMGVVQRDGSLLGNSLGQHEETVDKEMPRKNNMLFDKSTPNADRLANNVNQFVDKRRLDNEAKEPTHVLPPAKKGERWRRRRESILEEESITEEVVSKMENKPSSRVSNCPLVSKHLI
uniref:Family with sequence similarity 83 member E n=1 Tax=Amphiprion percula TaxID=161767 RepID=A0A3P8RY44_AMPPE